MTIAEELKIKEFPFEIKDSNGNLIYYETSNGFWYRCEYDSKGNEIYYIDSNGHWSKREYDSKGNLIHYEDSDEYWSKREYDSKGNQIYFESSIGAIIDKRPKSPKIEVDEKTTINGWISVTEALPKPLQTVWLTNGKWVCLGCLVESDGGWHWAESNGIIYVENGEIVSECESEDLDVKFWHELPKLPCL